MSYDDYCVRIEALENGFSVSVPDLEERAKKEAEAKKKHGSGSVSPYYGDCTKKFAAKSVKEVLRLVQASLSKMPEADFDAAFDEAAGKS